MRPALAAVTSYVVCLRDMERTLDPTTGASAERRDRFDGLAADLRQSPDPIHQHMASTMASFAPGLFAGGDDAELPADNLDLERAFRLPKGQERRIHGHAHAGVRIVQRGPTLLPVLDAQARHPDPFQVKDLAPWANAQVPDSQRTCLRRRRIMRRARSTKQRPLLLAELERRYREASPGG